MNLEDCLTVRNALPDLIAEIRRLRAENEELQASQDLQQAAYHRAKDRWQAATGRSDIWPDLADLCVWLMETTERLRAIVDQLPNKEDG